MPGTDLEKLTSTEHGWIHFPEGDISRIGLQIEETKNVPAARFCRW
jgi:hypothetical protein